MIRIAAEEALKERYRSDSIEKYLVAEFRTPGSELPFLTVSDGRKFCTMSLEESLSSGENLDFGSCEASQIKLTVLDVEAALKGCEMTLYQTLDGIYPALDLYPALDAYPAGYTMPLGKYVIQSATRQANRRYLDITALDYMCKFDVDVIGWYNSLAFPIPLRDFRASLCRRIGVAESIPDYLPNDYVMVEKTIDAAELIGRDVLVACEQLNGVFGHFDRNGVLQHITLQPNYCLVPSSSLYPSTDLYPVLPGEMNEQVYDERITRNLYRSCQFEEYTVQPISKVQIRQEEGDIGAIYGAGENCYTVEENFLAFGKSAEALSEIARGVYGMVNGRQYIPYECDLKGLPYIEVGDTELIESDNGDIVSYVIKRILNGVYALKDTHSATGEEIRRAERNVNTEIIQLHGKSAILKKNVEEVSAHLIDLEKQTEAQFRITANQILAEVKRSKDAEAALSIKADQIALSVMNLKNDTEAQFRITADQILMRVSKGEVSSQLSIEPYDITIKTNRLSWDATNCSMTKTGDLTCRNMKALNGTFSGSLETNIFSVNDQDIWIGDFNISADGTNVFQTGDGSVAIQTAAGGPFGSYAVIRLSTALGTTEVSDHHIETSNIFATQNVNSTDIWLGDLENRYGPEWKSVSYNIISLWDRIATIESLLP